jgi:hypothetical protein
MNVLFVVCTRRLKGGEQEDQGGNVSDEALDRGEMDTPRKGVPIGGGG